MVIKSVAYQWNEISTAATTNDRKAPIMRRKKIPCTLWNSIPKTEWTCLRADRNIPVNFAFFLQEFSEETSCFLRSHEVIAIEQLRY